MRGNEPDLRPRLGLEAWTASDPVAWYVAIVMNAQEQFRQAFTELQAGTFVKDSQCR